MGKSLAQTQINQTTQGHALYFLHYHVVYVYSHLHSLCLRKERGNDLAGDRDVNSQSLSLSDLDSPRVCGLV